MDAMEYSSEVSRHYKKNNGTHVFYSFTHDVETLLRKGLNVIHALADIGQRFVSKSQDSNNATLNTEAHEHVLMKCRKCVKTQMEDKDE